MPRLIQPPYICPRPVVSSSVQLTPVDYDTIHEARAAPQYQNVRVTQAADAALLAPAIDWVGMSNGDRTFAEDPFLRRQWLPGNIDSSPGLAGSGRTLIVHAASLAALVMNANKTASLVWSPANAVARHITTYPTVSMEIDYPQQETAYQTAVFSPVSGKANGGVIVGACDASTGGDWAGSLTSGTNQLTQAYLSGGNVANAYAATTAWVGVLLRVTTYRPGGNVVYSTHRRPSNVVTLPLTTSGAEFANWQAVERNMFWGVWNGTDALPITNTLNVIGDRTQDTRLRTLTPV